jgi:hypothetical protein
MNKQTTKCEFGGPINEIYGLNDDNQTTLACSVSSIYHQNMYRLTPPVILGGANYHTFCYLCTENVYYNHGWDFYENDIEKIRERFGWWPNRNEVLSGVHPKGVITNFSRAVDELVLLLSQNLVDEGLAVPQIADTPHEVDLDAHNDSYLAIFDLIHNPYETSSEFLGDDELPTKISRISMAEQTSFFELIAETSAFFTNKKHHRQGFWKNSTVTDKHIDVVDEAFPVLDLLQIIINNSAIRYSRQALRKATSEGNKSKFREN